ncbi:MAG: DUF896 domain-containing protein [Eubacteriales bacterium]|nr:DUF896 domain-containing protein [Eubacteriales bacterium]
MTQEKIARINELAKKAKSPAGLTPEEITEQKALREEYIAGFRASMKAQLDNTYLVDEKGNKKKLGQKKPYNGLRHGR